MWSRCRDRMAIILVALSLYVDVTTASHESSSTHDDLNRLRFDANKLHHPTLLAARSQMSDIFIEQYKVWDMFRDARNGLWCDSVRFNNGSVCGPGNNRYSSAGTGMGLVSDAIAAEVGLLSRRVALLRVNQTLTTILKQWPREPFHGFYVHFTDANGSVLSEFSTVDTAEMVLGASFAGNYFGGQVKALSQQLVGSVSWRDAISSDSTPTIYPVVNATTGMLSGNIRPYNEYFLVAYLAMLTDKGGVGQKYFERYYAANSSSGPSGDPTYPVNVNYWGYNLLSDRNHTFVSSFIPQFCYFLSKGFNTNQYYSTLLENSYKAEVKFWSLNLGSNSKMWGAPIYGKIFGCGAGAGTSGYDVDRIDRNPTQVASVAIMAGFLTLQDKEIRGLINSQINWLYVASVQGLSFC